jgi:hypothetical protein
MKKTFSNFRFKLLAVAFLLIAFSCEKDNENESLVTQELFNAPSIVSAKQFFNQNSRYTNTNGTQARNTFNTLQTDWQSSKTTKYKETVENDVDILYTPIYIETDKDAKAFVASTEQGGNVESKIIFVLHKVSNNENGLSAYVFVYNLNGTLEFEYNFDNGQSVPFVENANGLQSRTTDCGELPNLTPEELLAWLAQCTIALNEVVVYGQLNTIESGDSGGGGLDFSPWVQIDGLGYEDGTSGANGSNPQVFVSSLVSATGFSISTALGLPFSSIESQWLTQQSIDNQSLLNAIAQFLNNNKERSPDPAFENVNPNQLPEIRDEAVNFVLNYVIGTTGQVDFEELFIESLTPDDEYIYQGGKMQIPSSLILDNGDEISIDFGTTASDNQSADQEVSIDLVSALKFAVEHANENLESDEQIESLYIMATTNGSHSATSNHTNGTAMDISRINGVKMAVSGVTNQIEELQIAFDAYIFIRENFGPHFKHKFFNSNGTWNYDYPISGHNDHIHISVRR